MSAKLPSRLRLSNAARTFPAMRIVYFGSGGFGLPTLAALHATHEVALVVTQPDRPAGRHRRLTATPIAEWAERHNLPLLKPERVNAGEVVERARSVGADANIVVAFGQKIGDAIIALPRHGRVATMNLHASLLPKYRGAAPINWAILRGETVTGNTVFSLVDRMDAGDILGSQSTPIESRDTAGDLHDRLSEMGPELVLDVLRKLESGRLAPQPQDESQATLAPKLSREDAKLDFTAPADEVRRRVHGLYPWPGVTVYYEVTGQVRQPVKLCRVEVAEGIGPPGAMITDGVIAAGSGAVRLLEVQPPGKKPMPWADFRRGHALSQGTVFYGGHAAANQA